MVAPGIHEKLTPALDDSPQSIATNSTKRKPEDMADENSSSTREDSSVHGADDSENRAFKSANIWEPQPVIRLCCQGKEWFVHSQLLKSESSFFQQLLSAQPQNVIVRRGSSAGMVDGSGSIVLDDSDAREIGNYVSSLYALASSKDATLESGSLQPRSPRAKVGLAKIAQLFGHVRMRAEAERLLSESLEKLSGSILAQAFRNRTQDKQKITMNAWANAWNECNKDGEPGSDSEVCEAIRDQMVTAFADHCCGEAALMLRAEGLDDFADRVLFNLISNRDTAPAKSGRGGRKGRY